MKILVKSDESSSIHEDLHVVENKQDNEYDHDIECDHDTENENNTENQ